MAILAKALTTTARVKSRLEIASGTTTWDALIAELINAATEYIEGECGRVFLSGTKTNEVYSIENGQKLLPLRAWPVASVSSIQYRAGSISSPSWTTINANDWEIVGDGKMGVIRLLISLNDINALRITYVAGYEIDFTTAANHTLPYELSDLCERLAVRAFKKREAEGKDTESASAGGTVTWQKGLSDDDKRILQRYIRQIFL